MMNINVLFDLSNPVHATVFARLVGECAKANISYSVGETTTAKAPAKAPVKAPVEKSSKKTSAEPDYSTDFDLTLDKGGKIHLELGHHGRGSCRAAAGKLRGMGLTVADGDKEYGYFVAGKKGAVDRKATKVIFDNLGGKLHIANEDYARRERA